MRIFIFASALLLAGISACAFVCGGIRASNCLITVQQENTATSSTHESRFACDAMALTPELRRRHFEELSPALRSVNKSIRELTNGYEFEFPADQKTFQMLTEWVIQERECCPFFDIDVRLDREKGPMWLRLTGREGTKDFVKAEFEKWFDR
ncbi:MAG TPA: hypothetical protein VEZ90_11990 [Blastocatellia bacterium]|nr:hypothetical protein [Blastocatellia bacterium]